MRVLTSMLVGLLVAAPVFAVQVPQTPKSSKPKKDDPPQFDRDGDAARKKASDHAEETPDAALDKALPMVTTWPAEGGENAIRALVARGPEMVPTFQARLRSGTVLEKSASARALCLLGDKGSFDAIRQLLSDARQRARYPALLTSLCDLDAKRAIDLASTLLEADQVPLRSAAATLLRAHDSPELRTALRERLVAVKSDAVRFDIFALLEQLKDKELPALALQHFLGDDAHQLAAKVDELLSYQEDPEIRKELARLARTDRERRGLHAALTLAIAELRVHAPLLPDDLFDAYTPYLKTGDHLMRSVACIVCGLIGYRTESHGDAMRTQIVPALAELVVNGRFFGDFELCFGLSVGTLKLLTGENFNSVPEWRQWYTKSSHAITSRRELQGFALDEDSRTGVVRLEIRDSAGRMPERLVVAGSDARSIVSAGDKPGWVCLSADAMRALLDGLIVDGFLAPDLARTLPDAKTGARRLTVEARGRERSVMGQIDDARIATLVDRVRRSAEPCFWQLLLEPGDAHARRFAEETAWFETHPDRAEQKGRLIDLALATIGRADDGDAERAFDVLASFDRLGDAVKPAQIDGIASLLKRLAASDNRSRRLFDLLLNTGRADAFPALADALTARGAAGIPWLAEAIAASKQQATALADPRPFVRLAALEPTAGPRPASDQLIALANGDGDERVRVKALERLAEVGDEQSSRTLAAIATSTDTPKSVQAQALRLLGRVPLDDALATLTKFARESDTFLASAALEGLSRRGDDAAAAALDGIARERGAADPLGRLALGAIKGLPHKLAADRLRLLMNEAPDELKHEAAYALADLGEMDAAPALFADLEDAARHPRATRLLTYLFCQDVGTESFKFRSLYESRPGVTHAQLFAEALRAGGAIVPENANLMDRAFVPVLVAAVEDKRWFVRRCSLEALEAQTGRSLGLLAVNASAEEVAALAKRWREATSTQAQGSDQH
jgi:HEAT repeat protein